MTDTRSGLLTSIAAWTDYPFTELGDTEGKKAPVRAVTIHAYDGDKYASITVDGAVAYIKAGYCYTRKGRLGEVPAVSRRRLNRLPLPSHLS